MDYNFFLNTHLRKVENFKYRKIWDAESNFIL